MMKEKSLLSEEVVWPSLGIHSPFPAMHDVDGKSLLSEEVMWPSLGIHCIPILTIHDVDEDGKSLLSEEVMWPSLGKHFIPILTIHMGENFQDESGI